MLRRILGRQRDQGWWSPGARSQGGWGGQGAGTGDRPPSWGWHSGGKRGRVAWQVLEVERRGRPPPRDPWPPRPHCRCPSRPWRRNSGTLWSNTQDPGVRVSRGGWQWLGLVDLKEDSKLSHFLQQNRQRSKKSCGCAVGPRRNNPTKNHCLDHKLSWKLDNHRERNIYKNVLFN